MEFILSLPKKNESWLQLMMKSVRSWWIKKKQPKEEENYFLID
jgi:hypothetical protein